MVQSIYDLIGQPRTLSALLRNQQDDPYDLNALDEESALKSVGRGALSGIGYIGSSLQKPGRSVRALLAMLTGGNASPSELLAFLPFSDALGITDASNEVTGRHLLENTGTVGANQVGQLDFGDVAGFGVDVLTDPLTYMTFGASAVGKGGQLLRKAGILDDALRGVQYAEKIGPRTAGLRTTVSDVLSGLSKSASDDLEIALAKQGLKRSEFEALHGAEALRSSFGLGLPFQKPAIGVTLPGAEWRAGKFDRLADALKYSKPGVVLNRAFNANALDASSPSAQRYAELVQAPAIRAARQANAAKKFEILAKAHDAGLLNPVGDKQLWEHLENPTQAAAKGVGPQEASDVARVVRELNHEQINRSKSLGSPIKQKVDKAVEEYAARFSTKLSSAFAKRKPLLEGIKGGVNTINDLTTDADVVRAIEKGASTKKLAQLIELKYGHLIPPTYTEQLSKKTIAEISARTGQPYVPKQVARYAAMARQLKELPKEALETGMFPNNPLLDGFQRIEKNEEVLQAVDAGWKLLADPANHVAGGVPLPEVVKSMRVGSKEALRILGPKLNITKLSQLKRIQIDPETAKSIARFIKPDKPTLGSTLRLFDQAQGIWKAGVTARPAFHVRNRISGMIRNWMDDAYSFQTDRGMQKILAGKDWEGSKLLPVVQQILKQRGMVVDDRSATNVVRELLATYTPFQKAGLALEDVGAGPAGEAINKVMGQFPGGVSGSHPTSWFGSSEALKHLKESYPGKYNPLSQENALFKVSRDTAAYVEGMNRGQPFLHKLQQGMSPAEAGRAVEAAQVGYGAEKFTNFEKNWLKRLLPFYSFMRGATMDAVRDIVRHPGGKQATVIKGLARATDVNAFLPSDVTQGGAISGSVIGSPTDAQGNPRYITNLGLMFEQPMALAGGVASGSPLETLRTLGGSLGPVAKAPIELITGKSLFRQTPTGLKDLEDLDPLLGRTLGNLATIGQPEGTESEAVQIPRALESLVSNSPISSHLSLLRTLTDPRKRYEGIPLGALPAALSGVKFTDVSPQARDAVIRDEVKALLQDNRLVHTFENLYVRPEDVAQLSPEDRKLIALLKLQAKRRREELKKKAG